MGSALPEQNVACVVCWDIKDLMDKDNFTNVMLSFDNTAQQLRPKGSPVSKIEMDRPVKVMEFWES